MLRKYIFVNVEKSYENKFNQEKLEENISRLKALAYIVIAFEFFLIVADIISLFSNVDNRFHYIQYLIAYFTMFMINLLIILIIKCRYKIKLLKNQKVIETIIVFYFAFMVCWGSIVTLLDQELYGHLMTYMINLIIVSILFYNDIKKYFISFILSFLIISIGLPFFQKSSDILIGHYINLIIFSTLSFTCSRIIYFKYYIDFQNRMLLEKTQAELERLSYSDELTLLPNRRSYNKYIEKNYINRNIENNILSTMMIDIDYFKQYNDNYGHVYGDKVLQAVAEQLSIIVDKYGGFAARIGGEEFIFFLENIDQITAYEIADNLRKAVFDLKIIHSYSTYRYLTISIGISISKLENSIDILKCVEASDKALYNAKNSGRNTIIIRQE